MIQEKGMDVIALTETWLKPGDDALANTLCPPGYSFKGTPRPSAKGKCGGGIGIVYKSKIACDVQQSKSYKTFEHMTVKLNLETPVVLCIIYKLHSKQKYYFPPKEFYEEIEDCLVALSCQKIEDVCIVGDINIHLDDPADPGTKRFTEILSNLGFSLLVKEPTHEQGHTLDVIIARETSSIVRNICIEDPALSDHFLLQFILDRKPPPTTKVLVNRRKIRNMNLESFSQSVREALMEPLAQGNEISTVPLYNKVITDSLDKHAPMKTITLKPGGEKKWYDDEVHEARRKRRRAERKFEKTKLTVHKEMLKAQSKAVAQLVKQKKASHYKRTFAEADSKETFKIVGGLLSASDGGSLPSDKDDASLAQEFANFFKSKITDIHQSLVLEDDGQEEALDQPATVNARTRPPPFHTFVEQSEDEVRKVVMKCPNKSCSMDPIPTSLLKDNHVLPILLPTITNVINRSLSTGGVPSEFKVAQVIPRLKKEGLDVENLKNFRPVSNLPFLSKVLEKIVASQLMSHLYEHHLLDPLQSAYRKGHSTETALLKIKSDVDAILDEGDGVALVLLDLSCAFDTLDHATLIKRMEEYFGITGTALSWIKSYLTDRHQRIHIREATSESVQLETGVPQGSVLGPILFTLYVRPLAEIIDGFNMGRHGYADDIQLYTRLRLNSMEDMLADIKAMENCINEIRQWMKLNKLKLNESKTELMFITKKRHTSLVENLSIKVGDSVIKPSNAVRNLGATFDENLSMKNQISKTVQSGYYHLRRVKHIRHYLDKSTCAKVINATVTSRLDFHNGLLAGARAYQLRALQVLQNNAARLLTGTKTHDHITPVLTSLHWLPVRYRIDFKVLSIIQRALHDHEAPRYIKDSVSVRRPTRELRSSNDVYLLDVPVSRSHEGERRFQRHGAMLWNALPENLRRPMSRENFKAKLKTFLFRKVYVSKHLR
jgi:hypothetical protein